MTSTLAFWTAHFCVHTCYINKINYILFPFCPADAAIAATIPLADICMIYWQHLTPKRACLQSPYLLLVHNNRFFILNEVTIKTAIFFTGKMYTWWFIIVVLFFVFLGGLFLVYIKYLKLLTIENTILIFHFYK